MDFKPSATQEVILKVLFQKELDPYTKKLVQIERVVDTEEFFIDETEMTEVEIYEFLTDKKYDAARLAEIKVNKIDLICGRRAGKTTLSAMISIYCAITTNWKPFLSKTPFATVLIMSHSKEFSDEVLDIVKQFVTDSAILSRLINKKRKQTVSAMNLIMPFIVDNQIENSVVQIKVGAASSKTTRGVAACAILCDEIGHWNLDESMKETDVKILEAVRPAMKQFGTHAMLIKLSSPGIKRGVLFTDYEKDRKGVLPETYAVFKAPSWMLNPILPKEEFIEEYLLDPVSFDVEYRANFSDSLSNFIMPESIDMAVQLGVKFSPPSDDKGIQYFAAIDAAFKSDRFTFSLVGISDNRVIQFISKGWEGTRSNPIKANEVAAWIKNATKDFPLDHISADQFSFNPLKEIFDKYGLNIVEYTFTNPYKKKLYYNLKNLIHRQQLDLLDNGIQTRELKELIVEQSNNGVVRIGHPAGGSDDYSDSLAVACLNAVENVGMGKFEFESMISVKTHGVKTDVNGVAFNAPTPEMLALSGHLDADILDNSGDYQLDPDDGVLKHISELEDDNDGFSFVF